MPSDAESVKDQTLLDLTGTPCGICGPSTCDEAMIGCDGCPGWFHVRCVGLTEGKLPKKWYCKSEACQEKAQEYQKQKDSKKPTRNRKQTNESESSNVSNVGTKVRALEDRQKQQLAELEAAMQLKRKEKEFQRALERKKMEMEEEMRAEKEEEKKAWQAEMLQRKREHIQRMEANRKSFEMQMAAMNKKLEELSVPHVPQSGSKLVGSGTQAGEPSGKINKNVLKLTKANLKDWRRIPTRTPTKMKTRRMKMTATILSTRVRRISRVSRVRFARGWEWRGIQFHRLGVTSTV